MDIWFASRWLDGDFSIRRGARCCASPSGRGTEVERRRTRRIVSAVPVRITNVPLGPSLGVTRDLSLSGAYFYVGTGSWQTGISIEYVITLPAEATLADPTSVMCIGTIVRIEPVNAKMGVAVRVDLLRVTNNTFRPGGYSA